MEVADGMTAFKILQDPETAIDISVINLDMPGMDGIELIRHIAKGGRPVSVVLDTRQRSSVSLFSVETMSRAYGVNLLGTWKCRQRRKTMSVFVERFQRHAERLAPMECKADHHRRRHTTGGRQTGVRTPIPTVFRQADRCAARKPCARWHHPEYGIISPAVFIPMLEQQGEMEAFAWIVIDKAISACMRWHTQGFPLSVSINLSPSCLSHADFSSEKLLDLVAARNVDPQTIVIEVTESSAVTNMPYFLENLARLRMKGFGISVDDYGTGHSSLQQLPRIPFSKSEDRSLVRGRSVVQPGIGTGTEFQPERFAVNSSNSRLRSASKPNRIGISCGNWVASMHKAITSPSRWRRTRCRCGYMNGHSSFNIPLLT